MVRLAEVLGHLAVQVIDEMSDTPPQPCTCLSHAPALVVSHFFVVPSAVEVIESVAESVDVPMS